MSTALNHGTLGDYGSFSVEDELEPGVSLEDAIAQTEQLRSKHRGMVYRVRPKADHPNLYRIERKMLEEVQSQRSRALSDWVAGFVNRWRRLG